MPFDILALLAWFGAAFRRNLFFESKPRMSRSYPESVTPKSPAVAN
jgi:hypothetical protein